MRRLAAAPPAVQLEEVKRFNAYRPGLKGIAANTAVVDDPFWFRPRWALGP